MSELINLGNGMWTNLEQMDLMREAFQEADRRFWGMLLGTIPIPPPPPKQEYWLTTSHEMVVVMEDGVHKVLSNPGDIDPLPYSPVEGVSLLRRCRSMDF